MSKVSFSKLGLTKNTQVGKFNWNEQEIEVKAYLPIQEKLELIGNVINNCQDENNFINEAKMAMFMDLEIAYHYTNINFTDKLRSDPAKLYDLLAGSGFLQDMYAVLPQTEVKAIVVWLDKTANHIYDYRNSIYGILDDVFDKVGLPAKMVINNRDLYYICAKTLKKLNIECEKTDNNEYVDDTDKSEEPANVSIPRTSTKKQK